MAGIYAAQINGVSISAVGTLLEVTAPSTGVIEITRIRVVQSNQSASEQSKILVRRMSAASTGTSQTPVPLGGWAAAATTARGNTISGEGTQSTVIFGEGFNFVAGWEWVAMSEWQRIIVPASGIFNVKLDLTPAGARTMGALIEFFEKN
jgi:hypothetical protein